MTLNLHAQLFLHAHSSHYIVQHHRLTPLASPHPLVRFQRPLKSRSVAASLLSIAGTPSRLRKCHDRADVRNVTRAATKGRMMMFLRLRRGRGHRRSSWVAHERSHAGISWPGARRLLLS